MDKDIRISLKQARVIDAVARTRGIEQAAKFLNMTQPVVSRSITGAEKCLGVPLFQRGWGGTEPTGWGEIVLKRCSMALSLIARAEDEIAEGATRPNLAVYLRWHHLDAVAAVAQLGSASSASVHLGMTQPAISRAVAAISEYSRTTLFERKRHGLEPTVQAQRLAVLRAELMQVLGDLRPLTLNVEGGLIGRLAVGMLPFSGQDLVAKVFGQLTNSHPLLRLMAVPGSYNMLSGALRRGEIDCMIGILRDPPPYPEFREIFLYNDTFTLVARSDHPCHGRAQTIASLENEKWIVAPHGTPVRTYFESLFQNAGATPPAQTCEILSFSNAERVIIESDSIGLLSYGPHHLANLPPGLKKVDVELPEAQIAIGLTVRKALGPEQILSAFETLLRNFLKADAAYSYSQNDSSLPQSA